LLIGHAKWSASTCQHPPTLRFIADIENQKRISFTIKQQSSVDEKSTKDWINASHNPLSNPLELSLGVRAQRSRKIRQTILGDRA
jgi:hypothetical protein